MDFLFGIALGITMNRASIVGGGDDTRNKTKEDKTKRKTNKGKAKEQRPDNKHTKTSASSFKNRSHVSLKKYLMTFLEEEDSAYIPLVKDTFGVLPVHHCNYEKACEDGNVNMLQTMIKNCDNSVLVVPNIDDESCLNDTKMPFEDLMEIMKIRRRCILAAATNGHTNILDYFKSLKGFNFDHQWTVLHHMDNKELFNLWMIAVENDDPKLFQWLEAMRHEHQETRLRQKPSLDRYFTKETKKQFTGGRKHGQNNVPCAHNILMDICPPESCIKKQLKQMSIKNS